jgi:diguanylate cyclase (GGDEF)-like protein
VASSPEIALDPGGEHRDRGSGLAQFAERLKKLHSVSTRWYESLDEAFTEYLNTGCDLFGLSIGVVFETQGTGLSVRALTGTRELRRGESFAPHLTPAAAIDGSGKAATSCDYPGAGLHPDFHQFIAAPILVSDETFGILSFSSGSSYPYRPFCSSDREIIDMMARSLARVVMEHRIHSERKRSENLERSRNRVLEMVAENRSQAAILQGLIHMAELQRPDALCSVLLRKDELLVWSAAPSFPADSLRLFQPVRASRGSSDLAASELTRATCLWQDLRQCPIWADRAPFAAQLGIESCMTTPVVSARGSLLGVIALHFRGAQKTTRADQELLQLSSHLAAVAIEQRRLYDWMEFQARHDSLTGLPNRLYFMELLEHALIDAASREGTLAVLFIDLDRFKQINDTLGHAMGDRLLKEVGSRLRRLLTEDDLAGRMGGDEFTIVLSRQPDEQSAMQASEELLHAFRAPYRIEGNELFVTASMGVAIFPKHGATAAELLRNADVAMYHAKNNGKNDVSLFLDRDQAAGLERLRLENALRRALENHELDLLYQPVISMNGQLDALEALITWNHPVYGTISPKQFIPIAEETGLIVAIGSWVIQEACLAASRWHKAGFPEARISVNVSALQFERRDFVDAVAAALAMSGLPARSLTLELTESYVMRDLPQSVARMAKIRDLGVSIAIDDFGTGYSSLSYLNTLPVDSLKIDQSFVRNLQEPDGSLPVVQGIVRLAHSMNLTVVAEGVETREELELVRLLGCDKVQGNLYGSRLRAEHVEMLLAHNEATPPPGFPGSSAVGAD